MYKRQALRSAIVLTALPFSIATLYSLPSTLTVTSPVASEGTFTVIVSSSPTDVYKRQVNNSSSNPTTAKSAVDRLAEQQILRKIKRLIPKSKVGVEAVSYTHLLLKENKLMKMQFTKLFQKQNLRMFIIS